MLISQNKREMQACKGAGDPVQMVSGSSREHESQKMAKVLQIVELRCAYAFKSQSKQEDVMPCRYCGMR